MNRPVRTYEELLIHQQQLKETVEIHRQILSQDVEKLKTELQPLFKMTKLASRFFIRNRDHSFFVNAGSSLIDLAIRKLFLKKAGWFGKMVIPFLSKNISSHIAAGSQDSFLDKMESWLKRGKTKAD